MVHVWEVTYKPTPLDRHFVLDVLRYGDDNPFTIVEDDFEQRVGHLTNEQREEYASDIRFIREQLADENNYSSLKLEVD